MIEERYTGYDVQKDEIDITDPYQENILYDVVTAVRALISPKYRDVERYLNYRYSTETVVNFLRWAEKNGYINGHGGHYNKNGGGAKIWDFLKLPKYPYRWLAKSEDMARAIPDNWRRDLFKFYGYNLLLYKNRVIAISKKDATIERLYRAHFDRYINYLLRDDDTPELLPDRVYSIHTSDHDLKQPMPRRVKRDGTLIWDGDDNQPFPSCLHCTHNKGILYQFIGGSWLHILNTVLCDCRPHPIDRVWNWYFANWCKWYDIPMKI